MARAQDEADASNDDLLLGKAFCTVAGNRLSHSYFIIERSRPLPDATALASRPGARRRGARLSA